DLDADLGDRAEPAGERRDVHRGAIAEFAGALFDRHGEGIGLGRGHGGAGVDDHGRLAFQTWAVEEGQRRAGRYEVAGARQGYQGFDLAGSDDRPFADLARFFDARLVDRFRRAGRQAGSVEAAIAVEVDHDPFQRRRLAAARFGDVEEAGEADRREALHR